MIYIEKVKTHIMLKWGLNLEYSEEIGNSNLVCSCAFSKTNYLISSNKTSFLINNQQIQYSIPTAFSALYYASKEEIVIGSSVGIPSLHIFTPTVPPQFILRDFLLHQSTIHQVYCSFSSKIIITVGNDIKVWNVDISKTARRQYKLTLRSTLKGSQFCNGLNKVYINEQKQRIFVPNFHGFILYNFDGRVLTDKSNLSLSNFTALSLLPFSKNIPGLDISEDTIINIFQRMATVDSKGNIRTWHKSGGTLYNIPSFSPSSSIFFIEYINSEFVITINYDGEIFLVDVKSFKVKIVYKIDTRPDNANMFKFNDNDSILMITTGRKLYAFTVHTYWKLYYHPVLYTTDISRICSTGNSSRLTFLTKDGSLFIFSPSLKQLIGSASTRKCPRPISFSYDREYHDNQILFSMDDSHVHLYDYFKTDWSLKQILPIKASIIIHVIGTESMKWCLCAFGFFGDVIFYKFGSWELITRISVGYSKCDFGFWSKKHSCVIVICDNKINVISLKNFTVTVSQSFPIPMQAAFEDETLLVSYKNGIIKQYNITLNCISSSIQSNLGKEINYIHLKYGCHAIVLENNCVVIGDGKNISKYSIELPYQIYSVAFLDSNLDLLLALDHEIMVIKKKYTFPNLFPSFVPFNDLDDNKNEPLIISKKAKIPQNITIQDESEEIEDIKKETAEDVLRHIRQKIYEEEQNNLVLALPKQDKLSSSPRLKTIKNPEPDKMRGNQKNGEYKKYRKSVELIINERTTPKQPKNIAQEEFSAEVKTPTVSDAHSERVKSESSKDNLIKIEEKNGSNFHFTKPYNSIDPDYINGENESVKQQPLQKSKSKLAVAKTCNESSKVQTNKSLFSHKLGLNEKLPSENDYLLETHTNINKGFNHGEINEYSVNSNIFQSISNNSNYNINKGEKPFLPKKITNCNPINSVSFNLATDIHEKNTNYSSKSIIGSHSNIQDSESSSTMDKFEVKNNFNSRNQNNVCPKMQCYSSQGSFFNENNSIDIEKSCLIPISSNYMPQNRNSNQISFLNSTIAQDNSATLQSCKDEEIKVNDSRDQEENSIPIIQSSDSCSSTSLKAKTKFKRLKKKIQKKAKERSDISYKKFKFEKSRTVNTLKLFRNSNNLFTADRQYHQRQQNFSDIHNYDIEIHQIKEPMQSQSPSVRRTKILTNNDNVQNPIGKSESLGEKEILKCSLLNANHMQPIVTKKSLELYNPMNTPKLAIHIERLSKSVNNTPRKQNVMKNLKEKTKRKLIVKRQQNNEYELSNSSSNSLYHLL